MNLAKRTWELEASHSLAILTKAYELTRQGKDVISFAAGETDFNTPAHIKLAGIKAMIENKTKYTDSSGIIELKKAVCEKFKKDNNIDYNPENIIISTGSIQCMFNALMALCDPGDEVILPAPCYTSFPEQVKIVGAKAVFVNTKFEEKFKLNYSDLEKKVSKKTKVIILNTPCNPSGTIIEKEELEKIGQLAIEKGIYIISDEIYDRLVYEKGKHVSIASINGEIKKRVITINGVSKTYAMTGWRIGYAGADPEIIDKMDKIQVHSTANPNSIAQWASIEALLGLQNTVEEMLNEYKERRDLIVSLLNKIEGVECYQPEGGFYVFPKIDYLFKPKSKFKNSFELINYILDEYNVAITPGIAFKTEGHLRLAYTLSKECIEEGVQRIKCALESLY